MGWVSDLLTIWSSIRAVEKEIIEIRSKNRKPTLPGVGFEGGVDHRADKLVLINHETDRTGATQHSDTNQEPVALGVLILLRLVQQHCHKPERQKQNRK